MVIYIDFETKEEVEYDSDYESEPKEIKWIDTTTKQQVKYCEIQKVMEDWKRMNEKYEPMNKERIKFRQEVEREEKLRRDNWKMYLEEEKKNKRLKKKNETLQKRMRELLEANRQLQKELEEKEDEDEDV